MTLRTLANLKVHVHTEFGQLKKVLVGRADNFRIPRAGCDPIMDAMCAKAEILGASAKAPEMESIAFFGQQYPDSVIDRANKSLDDLSTMLENENVDVYRTDINGLQQQTSDTGWKGYSTRDCMLCVGNKLIISPGIWKSRRTEVEECFSHILDNIDLNHSEIIDLRKYSSLDVDPSYFLNENYVSPVDNDNKYVINNNMPLFDAANILCIKKNKILFQISDSGNICGMELLQKHLGDEVEIVPCKLYDGVHIDTTLAILNEEKILYSEQYVSLKQAKELFGSSGYKNDDNFIGMRADELFDVGYTVNGISSLFTGMNVFSVNENTVVVEGHQKELMSKLEKNGFRVLGVSIPHMRDFAGALHCTTLALERDD